MVCSAHTFFLVLAKCTVSVIQGVSRLVDITAGGIHTFDAYLLHQGEQLSQLLDQTNDIEPMRNNVVIVIGLSSIWHSCSGALVSKRVADTYQLYVHSRYCAFGWY